MGTREETFRKLYHEGLQLIADGKDDDGMKVLYEAAKTAPEGWLALSNELIKDGKYSVAEDRCKEILALTNDRRIRAAAFNNLGMIYCHFSLLDAALQAFIKAREEYPESPDPHSNLALLAQWEARFDDAIRLSNRALESDPWHEQAQFIKSMCLLLDGRYEEGFEAYECRWRSKTNNLQKLFCNKPEWDGTNGKSLFIYGEQGHGDSILMLRYAKEIHKLGIKQSWVTQKSMSPLLKLIPEIDCVVEVGDPLPDFDCHIPAVSLPRVFKTTTENIPASPYIAKPDDCKVYRGFNVGIVWRGSTAQTNDPIRSSSLEQWRDVLDVEGVTFHSLQVDNAAEGLLFPKIVQSTPPTSWLDTARAIANLDLIISVDTSMVHLAGAMGIPCWCALHSRPYFVYPPKFGERTPWYENVKLFRATKPHDWQNVFQRIATELCTRLNPS